LNDKAGKEWRWDFLYGSDIGVVALLLGEMAVCRMDYTMDSVEAC
jgi:hypothetical protein